MTVALSRRHCEKNQVRSGVGLTEFLDTLGVPDYYTVLVWYRTGTVINTYSYTIQPVWHNTGCVLEHPTERALTNLTKDF